MGDEEIKRAFARTVGEGQPPMSFAADDIIGRGGRIRKRRKAFTVVGSAVATAGAVAGIVLFLGQRPVPPRTVEPAAPPSSVELPAPSVPPAPPGASPVPTPATQSPSRTSTRPASRLPGATSQPTRQIPPAATTGP